MRNEMTASKLYGAEQPHKSSWPHHLLAGDGVEVPLQCRNHECNEERSRAILLGEVHLVAHPVGGRLLITTRGDIIRVLCVKPPLSLRDNSWIVSHLRTRKWFPL